MWFPPYGLTFSESVQANWQGTDFIGRPEPIYTYKNTSRTGSLTWKIVVDHPSVLNVIVNKVLANETNKTRIDSILESFFAGCRKYDLYELAKKYYTISPNDLFQIQTALSSKVLPPDQVKSVVNTLDSTPQVKSDNASTGGVPQNDLKNFENISFYFDNNIPKELGENYLPTYNAYTSPQRRYEYLISGPNSGATRSFFNSVIIPNKNRIDELINELQKQFIANTKDGIVNGTVTLYFKSSTSPKATEASNNILSAKRIDSAISYISENEKVAKYVKSGNLRFDDTGGVGEFTSTSTGTQVMAFDDKTGQFTPKGEVNCGDGDANSKPANTEVYTTNAMACRRAFISNITSTLNAPPADLPPKKTTVVTGNVVTKTETVPVIETTVVQRDNISKRVLRSLLSECDYFETIKEETPLVYDNLRDKLKFFQPAFHSITPEGLNSRLTFLQQCMRPGDTIPTVNVDNGTKSLSFNNATNTSFGAPPVLILRVGDFYNTKIIPTSLQLTYEELDINPEGIGVQPMIANVTLAFNFVGGSGLKESVDKLQNALTFNYYANTEIYDDRADSTDLSYKVIDADFLKSAIENNVAPPTINQAAPNNGQSNDKAVGTILTNVVGDTNQTGTLSYSSIMDKLVEESQNYFTNVVNKNRESLNQYNNAVRQQWMSERIYQKGKFMIVKNEPETILFGKPNNLEKRVDEIFGQLIKDIKNEDEGFIDFISKQNFTNRLVNQLQENYSNFVNNKRGSFQSAITNITNGMVNVQQNYIGYIGRINTITYNLPSNLNTGTDGYQTADGKINSYIISGTTEIDPGSTNVTNTLDELKEDVKKINSDITEFNTIVCSANTFTSNSKSYTGRLVFGPEYKFNTKEIFDPFNTDDFKDLTFRRVYMIVSNDVVDSKKYESFKNALIANILSNTALLTKGGNKKIGDVFDEYWLTIAKPAFDDENNITKAFIDGMEKSKLKDFLKYTPFNLKKKRTFTYTTDGANTDAQQTLIKGLGWTENQNTNNKTWNDESPSNVFISKAKLN